MSALSGAAVYRVSDGRRKMTQGCASRGGFPNCLILSGEETDFKTGVVGAVARNDEYCDIVAGVVYSGKYVIQEIKVDMYRKGSYLKRNRVRLTEMLELVSVYSGGCG